MKNTDWIPLIFVGSMFVGTVGLVSLAFANSLQGGFVAMIVAGFIWALLFAGGGK